MLPSSLHALFTTNLYVFQNYFQGNYSHESTSCPNAVLPSHPSSAADYSKSKHQFMDFSSSMSSTPGYSGIPDGKKIQNMIHSPNTSQSY